MSTLTDQSKAEKPRQAATPTDFESNSSLPSPLVLWVMRGVALLASVVCAYLVWIVLSGGTAVGCGGAMNCDEVLSSQWSTWFGVPVSFPAMSLYLSLLGVLAFAGAAAPDNVRRLAWNGIAGMTALAAVAGIYFIGLQLFDVKHLCTWCITLHACGFGLLLLTFAAGGGQLFPKFVSAGLFVSVGITTLIVGHVFQPQKQTLVADEFESSSSAPTVRFDIGPSPTVTPYEEMDTHTTGGDSASGASTNNGSTIAGDDNASLPAGVSFSDLDGFRVTPGDNVSTDVVDVEPPDIDTGYTPSEEPLVPVVPSSAPEDLASATAASDKQRLLNVLGGAAELNAYQYPIVGSYEADHVIIKLFDYTCPHCRQMHHHLEEAQAAAPDAIGVLMLAVPLNASCNPLVQHTSEKHKDACALAALSLAVWRLKPDQFRGYHHWLMTGDHAPSVPDAKAKAIELVGESPLETQLADPHLWQRLAIGVEVYRLAKKGVVPKLLLPKVMITGRATTRDELFDMLARHLDIEQLRNAPAEASGR